MIQINVGQKDKENQWRVTDLAEFLYTALPYQAMTNRNINAATLLEQYSVLVDLFITTKTEYMLEFYVY